MPKIGITTTVPVEMLLSAGYTPVDLNNVFVGTPSPEHFIRIAERAGFPLNCCSWIKGIYGVCMENNIRDVICVTSGDCSNTLMLMEVLRLKGLNAIPFAYPAEPDERLMAQTLEEFARTLGTTPRAAEEMRRKLTGVRRLAARLDELTWKENLASGWENHLWLVSTSDFGGDWQKYGQDLGTFIDECTRRSPYPEDELRLAYIGVPAVYARELYPFIERHGGRVVYNEIQRQFAMIDPAESLAGQYTNYTYPYSIRERIGDISTQLALRRIDGIIHYVQTFCHRSIGDIIFRATFRLPMLTIEGNADFSLTTHIKTRIEAFLDMLARNRSKTTHRLPKR
ncbi:MAG: 2-hydroxyacyl-CoA dehydratase [Dehalococcoidales bacterium]|nr:2-hydroxyacyl-CoA dehydratase [Dehalococcoidales bacterium]